MPKFRKRPVVIEAVHFDGTVESANHILAWMGKNGAAARRAHRTDPAQGLLIGTLEGDMRATPGDFIIKGVQGEFYPCKPDIFEATYEPAVES